MNNGGSRTDDKVAGAFGLPITEERIWHIVAAHFEEHSENFRKARKTVWACLQEVARDLALSAPSAASSNDAVTLLRAAAEQCRHSAETMNKEFNIADTGLAAMAKRIEEFLASPSSALSSDPIVQGGVDFIMGPGGDEGTRAGRHPDSPYAPSSHERRPIPAELAALLKRLEKTPPNIKLAVFSPAVLGDVTVGDLQDALSATRGNDEKG